MAAKKVTTPETSKPLFANGGTRAFGKGAKDKDKNPKKTTTKPKRKNPRIELTNRLI